MRRTLKWLAAVVTTFLAVSSAYAAPTARQKIASLQYLVGTWSCAHTVGTFSGTYKTTYANVLGNLWLRQISDFPPRQFGEKGDVVRAEFLMGYEERRQTHRKRKASRAESTMAARRCDSIAGRTRPARLPRNRRSRS